MDLPPNRAWPADRAFAGNVLCCFIGVLLGPLLEEHLRRAMILSRGTPMIFLERPISATLLALSVIALVVVLMPSVARKREEVFVEEG